MQQPGSLPPFPPTFNPNAQPPPGGFPPFRPPQGFIPPPFSSSFPPGASSSPNGANGFRPPVTPGMYPPRPAHPGLGLPPLPGGLPGNPHITGVLTNPPPSSAPPGFVRDVKTTSVFVGSIATGIGDQTLVDLLNASPSISQVSQLTVTARRADLCTSSKGSVEVAASLKLSVSPFSKAPKSS